MALTVPRPARFGWQMYAGISRPAVFTAVKPDGSLATVSLTSTSSGPVNIDLTRYSPPAICARTDAVAVGSAAIPDREPREVPCPR